MEIHIDKNLLFPIVTEDVIIIKDVEGQKALHIYEVQKEINFFCLYKTLGLDFDKLCLYGSSWFGFGEKCIQSMRAEHSRIFCLGYEFYDGYKAVFNSGGTFKREDGTFYFGSFSVHTNETVRPLDLVVIPRLVS